MHRLITALGALAIAFPAQAQRSTGMAHDPTTSVVGSGELPAGWLARFDTPRRGPTPALTEIRFVAMGAGHHVTSGPAAIYYNPKDVASGEYSVEATFSQTKTVMHEGYGVFLGGSGLQDSSQRYLYFLVRPMDSAYLINYRVGKDVRKIVGWTISPAMGKEDEMGKATNRLSIRVSRDSVYFVANGRQVKALAKVAISGFETDGQAGLRINHNVDVHVDGVVVAAGK
jgi:hypothetical protein